MPASKKHGWKNFLFIKKHLINTCTHSVHCASTRSNLNLIIFIDTMFYLNSIIIYNQCNFIFTLAWFWRMFCVIKHQHITWRCFCGNNTWVLRHVSSTINFTLVINLDLYLNFTTDRAKPTKFCNIILDMNRYESSNQSRMIYMYYEG